jgi:hypothetical protein
MLEMMGASDPEYQRTSSSSLQLKMASNETTLHKLGRKQNRRNKKVEEAKPEEFVVKNVVNGKVKYVLKWK